MAQLQGDDQLLRRVLNRLDFLVWDDDEERWLPSLAGIRFDPDGMSAFILRLLRARGAGSGDVATLGDTRSGALVFSTIVDSIEGLGFTVRETPNDATPIGHAHASVEAPAGLSPAAWRAVRTDLAAIMTCVHGAPAPERPGA